MSRYPELSSVLCERRHGFVVLFRRVTGLRRKALGVPVLLWVASIDGILLIAFAFLRKRIWSVTTIDVDVGALRLSSFVQSQWLFVHARTLRRIGRK